MRRGWRVWLALGVPLCALLIGMMVLAQLRPATIALEEGSCPSVFNCSLRQLSMELSRHPWAPTVTISQREEGINPDGVELTYDRKHHQLIWRHYIGPKTTEDWTWRPIREKDVREIARLPLSASQPMLPIMNALQKRGATVHLGTTEKPE